MTEETRAVVGAWEQFCRELAKEIAAADLNLSPETVLLAVADTMQRLSRSAMAPPPSTTTRHGETIQ